MSTPTANPWFHEALKLLDLRRRDRALMLTAAEPRHAKAAADLVGSEGSVLLVEPDRATAEQVVELDISQVEVLWTNPLDEEDFGNFDALLTCPLGMPSWSKDSLGLLARANLRPGGRFVFDLPAEQLSEDLASCWADIGGQPDDLRPLHGLSEADLSQQLRDCGLRRVQTVLGAHLLHLDSPQDLADLGAAALDIDEERRAELGRALALRLRTTGKVDVVLHRTRVHGIH